METVEPITPDVLAVILGWFEERGLGSMPAGVLPPFGVCTVDAAGLPLAAAWLYQPVGVPLAFMDWMISRPGLRPAVARPALQAVLASLAAVAKEQGCTRLFASVTHPVMLDEAVRCGFERVASDCYHLIKPL
jgi:hypothetical protein